MLSVRFDFSATETRVHSTLNAPVRNDWIDVTKGKF